MAATAKKYKAPRTPETWITPYNACRFSTLLMLRAQETLGEQLIRGNGTAYDRKDRTTLLRWLRRLGGQRAGKGIAASGYNRPDALYAYEKAFPRGKAVRANDRPSTIRENLGKGWSYSISGNVGKTRPGSPLRDHVNPVGHEIGIRAYSYKDGMVDVWEPMTPECWVRVPFSDVKDFSSAYSWDMGRRVCIRVKTGADTQAARARFQLAETIVDLETRLRRIRDERDEAQQRVAELSTALLDVTAQLTECREDCGPAAREQLLDALQEWLDAQRL